MYKLTVFLSFFYFTASAQYPNLSMLGNIGQKQSNWCVPASIEMVLTYYGKHRSQTDIYNLINDKNCTKESCGCNSSWLSKILVPKQTCEECNKAYPPDKVKDGTLLKILQESYLLPNTEQLDSTIKWDTIKTNIDNKFPLIWIVHGSTGYHAFVAFEYQEVTIDGEVDRLLHINDPLDVCEGCSFWIRFVEGHQFEGSHFSLFYVIIPKP
jgi:hypothetical protein